MLDRLSDAITSQGVPLHRVEGVIGSPILIFQDSATQQQRTQAQTIADSFDWSETADAVWRAAKNNLEQRAAASFLVSDPQAVAKLYRAVASVLLDELNVLRGLVFDQLIGTTQVTIDPPNIANGSGVTSANITVTGAAFGDFVDVAAPYSLQGLILTGYVSAADTVQVRLHNGTGGAVNLASGTWRVTVRRQTSLADRTLAQAKTAIGNKIDSGGVD